MTNSERCPLCDGVFIQRYPVTGRENITYRIDCATCGSFVISSDLLSWEPAIQDKRHLLSAVTKSKQGVTEVNADLIRQVENGEIAEKTVEEKLDIVLQTYAGRSKEIGAYCEMNPAVDYPLAWCRSKEEWKAIVDALDSSDFGYLKYQGTNGEKVQVTVKGWKWLAERPKAKGDVGFIAMAFDRSLDSVKDAIAQGIRSAGYAPLRINEDDYNGGIMDQILARIRESRFVVADFKLNKGGVYYEAGFAEGLGTDVFYVCEDCQVSEGADKEVKVHFDIRHLNFITWNSQDLPGLSEKLKNRIVRVLGKGPRSQ